MIGALCGVFPIAKLKFCKKEFCTKKMGIVGGDVYPNVAKFCKADINWF